MGFLKSAVNQVGRDLGKVVSNEIFNDKHSTPFRSTTKASKGREKKTEFEKAMSFQMGHRPATLVSKLTGVYSVVKNEIDRAIADGYLDSDEIKTLLHMLKAYNSKMSDVAEMLELDQEKNKALIEKVMVINTRLTEQFHDSMHLAIAGSQTKIQALSNNEEGLIKPSFIKHVVLSALWMGNYSKTGKLNILGTIAGNAFTVWTMYLYPIPIVILLLALYGALSFKEVLKPYEEKVHNLAKLKKVENLKIEIFKNSVNTSAAT